MLKTGFFLQLIFSFSFSLTILGSDYKNYSDSNIAKTFSSKQVNLLGDNYIYSHNETLESNITGNAFNFSEVYPSLNKSSNLENYSNTSNSSENTEHFNETLRSIEMKYQNKLTELNNTISNYNASLLHEDSSNSKNSTENESIQSIQNFKISENFDDDSLSITFGSSIDEKISNPSKPKTSSKKPIAKTTIPPSIKSNTTKKNQPKIPIICANEYQWNVKLRLCLPKYIICPIGFYFDEHEHHCVELKSLRNCSDPNKIYDKHTKECIKIQHCKQLNVCRKPNEMCIETEKSYKCRCKSGFKYNEFMDCEDLNECAANKTLCNMYGYRCVNTKGSYFCKRYISCGYGYEINETTQMCQDIDECKRKPSPCSKSMICVNVIGGHRCIPKPCTNGLLRNAHGKCTKCHVGYSWNKAKKKCLDIDECKLNKFFYKGPCKANQYCVNKPGGYACKKRLVCPIGLRLAASGRKCLDIDECITGTFRCPNPQTICVNVFRSYFCAPNPCKAKQIYSYKLKKCQCKAGFYFDAKTQRCEDIDECQIPQTPPTELFHDEKTGPCRKHEKCANFPGFYKCYAKWHCKPGYRRNATSGVCQDVNECKSKSRLCGEHEECVNTRGYFKCVCKSGFAMDKQTDLCKDVDECEVLDKNQTCADDRAICQNVPRTFQCLCPAGYTWRNNRCEDINECISNSPKLCGLANKCINKNGSYECVCVKGYESGPNNKSCVDINECEEDGGKLCEKGFCYNYDGGYHCECPRGFHLGIDHKCQDINECEFQPPHNNICNNINNIFWISNEKKSCINLFGQYACIQDFCRFGYQRLHIHNQAFDCLLDEDMVCPDKKPEKVTKKINDTTKNVTETIKCETTNLPRRIFHRFVEIMSPARLPYELVKFNINQLFDNIKSKKSRSASSSSSSSAAAETSKQLDHGGLQSDEAALIRQLIVRPDENNKQSHHSFKLQVLYAYNLVTKESQRVSSHIFQLTQPQFESNFLHVHLVKPIGAPSSIMSRITVEKRVPGKLAGFTKTIFSEIYLEIFITKYPEVLTKVILYT